MRKKIVTCSVVLIGLVLWSTPVSHAYIAANGLGGLIGSAELAEEAEREVILGGTSLLEGFAHVSMFFSRVEAAELDAAELETSLEHGRKALAALRLAEEHYRQLTLLFELHGTTRRGQVRLLTVDYKELGRRYQLNQAVWTELKKLVSRGDPEPLVAAMQERVLDLHSRMEAAVELARRGDSPSLVSYIAITRELTHLHLMAQYAALLFQAI